MAFNNISELMKKLKSDVSSIANKELAEEIKEVVHEESLHIYDEYMPFVYQRRYDKDGFADEDNIVSEVAMLNNGVSIEVRNDTLANGDEQGQYLDTFIENGVYGWTNQPDARPFMKRSLERVRDERLVNNVIKFNLEKHGW